MGLVALAFLVACALSTLGAFSAAPNAHARPLAPAIHTAEFHLPTGKDPWGTAFDSSGRVWVAVPGCDPTPSCGSTFPGKLMVYDPNKSSWVKVINLPSGFGQPLFLAFDGNGQLWFPMPMTNALGVYNPATNSIRKWAVPTPGSGPWAVAVAPNGIIWFTEHYSNKIGAFNPFTQHFSEIATSSPNSLPYGIAVDGANNVWFTENNASVAKIGEYTAQGMLKEYKIRNSSASNLTPHEIVIDNNGNPWWSEGWASSIGTLNVALAVPGTNRGVSEFHYGVSGASHTSGISIGSNGLVWFDDSLQGTYGSFTIGKGSFSIYHAPAGGNAHPHDGLHVDANNRVWFDEEFANSLAVAW